MTYNDGIRALAPLDREAMVERLADAVHQAYLTTADRLGWPVKPAMRVQYNDLPEDAKELDRATARAALAAMGVK